MTATAVRTPTAVRRPASDTLAGLGSMVRLVVRRNRVRLAVWWVVLVGMFAYVGSYYKSVFTTQASLDDFAALSNTPGIKALTGLAAAPATLGGAVWTKIWMTTALSLAFGVVFMRQYLIRALPTEIIEAAVVDGASTFRIFRSIVLPTARPAMAVLGMLTFLTAWNDFSWPLITLNSANPTIQVAFQSLASGFAPQQSIIMAGTLYGTIPVLIVFALLGRQIVGGIMEGAVKG